MHLLWIQAVRLVDNFEYLVFLKALQSIAKTVVKDRYNNIYKALDLFSITDKAFKCVIKDATHRASAKLNVYVFVICFVSVERDIFGMKPCTKYQ